MKRKTSPGRLILILAAFLPSIFTFAQGDTIFITHSATTYLLFAEEVTVVDIGKSNEYLSRIEGKCVFVKAAKEHPTPTSLLVQHGEDYFVALLAYKSQSNRFLYDFRKKVLPEKALQKDSNKEPDHSKDKNIDLEKVKRHFKNFEKSLQGVKQKTLRRDDVGLSLTHVANDKEATYLSFTFQNRSSIDYVLDVVTFERKEKKGKRFSQNNVSREFIEPVVSSFTKVIEAQGKANLQYAIPLYALGKRSHLEISFREKSGSRLLTLKLPARYINNASIYQPNEHDKN
jgi:hypothetical protein